MNKQKLGILSAIWVVSLIVTASIVYAFSGPSSTLYFSGGIYPGAPTYTIWVEGSTYYAKNAFGQIEYLSTNASYVIASAINLGNVFLKDGYYTMEGIHFNIPIPSNRILEGESEYNTIIDLNGDAYWAMIVNSNINAFGNLYGAPYNENITIRNLCLIGSGDDPNGDDTGMAFASVRNLKVENVYTYRNSGGLDMHNVDNAIIQNCRFENSLFGYPYPASDIQLVFMTNVTNSKFLYNDLIDSSREGFYISTGTINCSFIGNTLQSIEEEGFDIKAGCSRLDISHNYLYNVTNGVWCASPYMTFNTNHFTECYNAIVLDTANAANCTVANNIIDTMSTYGIAINYSANHNIFIGNQICNAVSWGIREVGGSPDFNTIIGCTTANCGVGIITIGASSQVNLSWNNTVWIP